MMAGLIFKSIRGLSWARRGLPFCALALILTSCTTLQHEKTAIIPTWSRFEQTFHSKIAYTNALQEAAVTVIFTSPFGITNRVDGFWDGEDVWRVRFSPNAPGRWTYRTYCSDSTNASLHGQTGNFLCSGALGVNQFQVHGPVRVSSDHHHFEHADGRAFLWIADCAWTGGLMAEPKDWEGYAAVRASQGFSAVQWSPAPGPDNKGDTAFSGKERISINPEFFRRMDARVDMLNSAGLLSVISPLGTTEPPDADALPADQLELLLRYEVARWGANDVAWLLTFDGEQAPGGGDHWKKAGSAVFGSIPHAPVIVYSGTGPLKLDDFRKESWVDVFGYGTGQVLDAAARQRLIDIPRQEWTQTPARPLLNVAPPFENGINVRDGKSIDSETVRRIAWQSLLLAPAAGTSYGAQGVAYWDTSMEPTDPKASIGGTPLWESSLFLTGAKQMEIVSKVMNSLDFWQLVPSPQNVLTPAVAVSPAHQIAAAASASRSVGVVYLPGDRSFEFALNALPQAPVIHWTNVRTGVESPAVAVVAEDRCQFPTPEAGDWLLSYHAGK
jgi:hypothetical protein